MSGYGNAAYTFPAQNFSTQENWGWGEFGRHYTVKKRLMIFQSSAGMSLTKLYLAWNN
jgi:hypothetical protein